VWTEGKGGRWVILNVTGCFFVRAGFSTAVLFFGRQEKFDRQQRLSIFAGGASK
jgi:hypothetical protein